MSTAYNKATAKSTPRQSRTVAGQTVRTNRSAGGLIAMLVVFILFGGLSLLLSIVSQKPETVIALGVALIVVLAIVRWPVVGTFISVTMTVLFDGFPSPYVHTFFSDLGVFRNLSYRGLPESVVISMFEVVVLLSLISALAQRFHQHKKLVRGPLFGPMMAFGAMVLFGEVNGLLSGGDFKISLWELRPLFYLVLLYILAVNTVERAW